jgi:hypothetical protein
MNVLLFLNGKKGSQTGIEDGFNYLKKNGEINNLQFIYFEEYLKIDTVANAILKMELMAEEFLPNMILFSHIGGFKLTLNFLNNLKNLPSKPFMVYDEGDMYGGISKAITKQMRLIISMADLISIRGLGDFYQEIKKINPRIIYTPHLADVIGYDKDITILNNRKFPITLIGNKTKRKILPRFLSLPGAVGREKLIKHIADSFPGLFYIFGNGWSKIKGNQGPIPFQKQLEIYQNSWVTLAYEHYPKIPYYFSNRLPLALLSGSLYVCHYHKGYDQIFKNCDFIFFFKTNEEAEDILNYIFSLSKENLLARSKKAREFALNNYTPDIVWAIFFKSIKLSLKP